MRVRNNYDLMTTMLSMIVQSENSQDKENANEVYFIYVPSGCAACGGPYPYCKTSCPIFDD